MRKKEREIYAHNTTENDIETFMRVCIMVLQFKKRVQASTGMHSVCSPFYIVLCTTFLYYMKESISLQL